MLRLLPVLLLAGVVGRGAGSRASLELEEKLVQAGRHAQLQKLLGGKTLGGFPEVSFLHRSS